MVRAMDPADLLAELRNPDSPHVDRLARIIVDRALARSLDRYADPAAVSTLCTRLADQNHLAKVVEQYGHEALDRTLSRVGQTDEVVGDWLPEEVRTRVLALLGKPGGPTLEWLAAAIDPSLLRELMTPVFREVLLGFAAKLTATLGSTASPDASRAGGLLGRLGKDVGLGTGRRLMEVGRSVMGGLGLDLQDRIRATADEFAGAASEAFRAAVKTRLASSEGQAIIAKMVRRGLDGLAAVPVREIQQDLARLPPSDALDLLPPFLAHNLQRELGQRILQSEFSAWFASEGQRSVEARLEDANILEPVRELLVRQVTDQLRELAASDAFEAWLHDLAPPG